MPSIGDQLLLKRGDLLTFPKETVDLILEMQKDGWRGHRNSQGHVKMLAPDGKTHVMATHNPRSPFYVRSGYRQYLKKHGKEETISPSPKTTQKWPCARPSCPKTYATEQHLNDHIAVDHEKLHLCPEPDCHDTFKKPAGLGLHRANMHGYVSPTKAKRDAAKKLKESQAKLVEELQAAVEIANMDIQPEWVDPAVTSGNKFDSGMAERFAYVGDGVVRTDEMLVEHIVPDFLVGADGSVTDNTSSLKELGAKFIAGGVMVVPDNWEPEFKPTGEFFLHSGEKPIIRDDGLDPVYTRTHEEVRLAYLDSQELFDKHVAITEAREAAEDITFIDERDSWVVDHEILGRRRIRDLEEMFKAAGLSMEIRVWKETK